MFQAVLQYLNDNNTEWNANTLIAASVQNLRSSVEAIQQQAAAQQGSNTKGYTAKKEQDIENVVDLCYKLALRVKNYAVSINDPVLKQAVDWSRRELETGKEMDIENRCLTIINKAGSVAATAPVEYKITPEMVEQARAAAAAITPGRAERDVVSGTRSSTTTQLNDLFTTARNQLNIIDDLIEGDADDDSAAFVRDYFIMRRTVDRRGSRSKDAGSDEDAGTVAGV